VNYPDSVEYLYALGNEHRAFKLGLEPVTRLLAALGAPHRAFRSAHVAGTNGKGSTSAMIESGLRHAGIRTGLFTSPHLVEPTERIRIAGGNISREKFAAAFNHVHETAERLIRNGELEAHPSYFETVTAMSFCVFQEEEVDTAIIEVGLGGRLDATNVISPELCVITVIDYDHEAWLGSSLESIAGEKAGILKPGVPAIFARQRLEAKAVLEARAAELACPVDHTASHEVQIMAATWDRTAFQLDGRDYICALAGAHQVDNAAAAVLALKHLAVPEPAIRDGLANVRWPGRLERVSAAPEIILDGAHNPSGARALAQYVRQFFSKRHVVLIYGAMRDKSVEEVTEILFPVATEIIVTAPSSPRALNPSAIAARADHPRVSTVANIAEALERARELPRDAVIFVSGSLYLVGEARGLLVK
jgi:dihydrofolate synthase/folylpolyglutamate synthase